MKLLSWFVLCLLIVHAASAQLATSAVPFPITGKFHVSVDDQADLHLNGVKFHQANIGESTSPEVTLKAGDRLLVKLWNKKGPRRFAVIFASTDRRFLISFPNETMKIVPDPELTDFTERQFGEFRRYAVQENKHERVKILPFANSSEWLWGVGAKCTLGAVIRRDMVKPLAQQ